MHWYRMLKGCEKTVVFDAVGDNENMLCKKTPYGHVNKAKNVIFTGVGL